MESGRDNPSAAAVGPNKAPAAASLLAPSGAQQLALAVLAALVIAVCAVLLLRGRGEPLAAAGDAGQGVAASPILVNINEADWPELSMVPGLGKALSQSIVAYRRANGPFASVDDLLAIRGIGRIRLEDLRPYVTVGQRRSSSGAVPPGETQGHVGVPTGQ